MKIISFITSADKNFTYLIYDDSKTGVLVDPSFMIDDIIRTIERDHINVAYILNTHDHVDHTASNDTFVSLTGAKVIAHRRANVSKDKVVDDNSNIKVSTMNFKVIYTPGHSKSSVCYLINDSLFTGDTLFVGECGRTDLPGGSIEELYDSLFNKLCKLPDHIKVYPGHDYGPRTTSTIGDEKKTNYTLKPRTLDEFIRFMTEP